VSGKEVEVDASCRSTPSYQRQAFTFYDHGSLFEEKGLLVKEGTHLTGWQEHLCKGFAARLANLERRALKQVQ